MLLVIMTQSKTHIAFTFYSSGCHLKGAWKIVLLSKQTNYSGVCREAESWIWTRKEESSERCNQVRCFQRNRFDIIDLLCFGDPKNKTFCCRSLERDLERLKADHATEVRILHSFWSWWILKYKRRTMLLLCFHFQPNWVLLRSQEILSSFYKIFCNYLFCNHTGGHHTARKKYPQIEFKGGEPDGEVQRRNLRQQKEAVGE